jgi:hypothetical protein
MFTQIAFMIVGLGAIVASAQEFVDSQEFEYVEAASGDTIDAMGRKGGNKDKDDRRKHHGRGTGRNYPSRYPYYYDFPLFETLPYFPITYFPPYYPYPQYPSYPSYPGPDYSYGPSTGSPQYGNPQYGPSVGNPQYGPSVGNPQYGPSVGNPQYGPSVGNPQYDNPNLGSSQYPSFGSTQPYPDYNLPSVGGPGGSPSYLQPPATGGPAYPPSVGSSQPYNPSVGSSPLTPPPVGGPPSYPQPPTTGGPGGPAYPPRAY